MRRVMNATSKTLFSQVTSLPIPDDVWDEHVGEWFSNRKSSPSEDQISSSLVFPF
jgi:hypothetical protein